ncbi:solute carrier family 2, facilitated glucose transporter member 1-like isoform X2 [Symsagittifera roscoffensis]
MARSEDQRALHDNEERASGNGGGSQVTGTLLFSIFSAVSCTGLSFGFNTGVLNNPSEHIKDFFNRAKTERSGEPFSDTGLTWFWSSCVAIWTLFAIVGCFVGGAMTSKFGRKRTMLLNNVFMVIGTLFQSCSKYANSYEMFFIGRLVMGIQSGICTSAGPMYLSEIAPKNIRGGVGVVFQLTCVLGILGSQILGFEAILGGADLWPILINMNLVLGFIQWVTLPFCPSSPRFLLVSREDREGARAALARLRGQSANIEEEMNEIIEEDRKEKSEPPVSWGDLIRIDYLRRPLIISCVLAMSQQLSGINAVNYFSSPIFNATLPQDKVDSDPDFPKYMVAVTGSVNLVITGVSVFTVDRLGRKLSHLVGLGGMAVCALLIGIFLSGLVIDNQTCHGLTPTKTTNDIAIVLIFVYVGFFSIGPGAIPWLIAPELFTSSPRPKAMAIANTTNWLCNFMIALAFDPIRQELCGWVFLIFFTLLVIFIGYLSVKMPNVEGKSASEIVQMFKDRPFGEETVPIISPTSMRDESKA